jgi:hypothetical protein
MNRRTRWLAGLAAVAVVATSAIAAPAHAEVSGIVVREISETWNVSPGFASNGLYCAAGEKVLQGGVLSMTLSNGVYLLSSRATLSDKWGWEIYNATSSTQEIRARVICATGVEGWETRSVTGDIPARSSASLVAGCPSGKAAIGGGWVEPLAGSKRGYWFVSASQRYYSPTSWRIHVTNDSLSTIQGLTAQAICTSQSGSTQSTSSVTVNPGATAAKSVDCGSSKWLVGGGFLNIASGRNIVTAAIPTAGSPATWKINVRNPDTVAHTVGIYYICMPK